MSYPFNYSGSSIFEAVQRLQLTLQTITEQVDNDYQVNTCRLNCIHIVHAQVRAWLSPFAMKHNYSQPWYLDQILDKVQMCSSMLESSSRSIRCIGPSVYSQIIIFVCRAEMFKYFHKDTIDELIVEYVQPHALKLSQLLLEARRLGAMETYARRPFPFVTVCFLLLEHFTSIIHPLGSI
jgi:hypothetical protein